MASKKRLTPEEYDQLYERLYEQKEKGTVTDAQLSVLLAKLDSMRDDGASKAEIEHALLHPPKTSDPGERATDRAVADLEKKIKRVYGAAAAPVAREKGLPSGASAYCSAVSNSASKSRSIPTPFSSWMWAS